MASVTIRAPESRVVRRCDKRLAALRVPVAPGAAVTVTVTAAAVAPAVPVAPVAARAVAARAAVPAAARATVARAHGGELLGGLAGDVGVLGQPQADPPALAVDLDHAHGDLVALVEHLLDRPDALAGRDVGDVQQAVGALGELDERPERGGLDHLAGVLVADLDLLGHRADALDEGVALGAGLRVDADLALVVDVDLRLVLLLQRADRLAALAD